MKYLRIMLGSWAFPLRQNVRVSLWFKPEHLRKYDLNISLVEDVYGYRQQTLLTLFTENKQFMFIY